MSHVGPPNGATAAPVAPNVAPSRCDVKKPPGTPKDKNPSRINDLGLLLGPSGTFGDAPGRRHIWSIITCKTHLSPRRITPLPHWHPPSPVKGPSIGNPPTFIGGARCTFVTWPNTEQDRSQCSSKDPAGKPLAGSTPEDHRPAGKRSTSAGRLRGRLLFYTVLRLPASDWTKR